MSNNCCKLATEVNLNTTLTPGFT